MFTGSFAARTCLVQVVVKEPRAAEHSDGVLHEAICLLSLNHPRVVTLVGLLLDRPVPLLVLGRVDGGCLRELLQRKGSKMQPAQKLRYCAQVRAPNCPREPWTRWRADCSARLALLGGFCLGVPGRGRGMHRLRRP